jgi:hypothetical protein
MTCAMMATSSPSLGMAEQAVHVVAGGAQARSAWLSLMAAGAGGCRPGWCRWQDAGMLTSFRQ